MRDGEKLLGKWGVIMGLGLQYDVIIAYAFGLILLYIIGWLLLVPLKIILKFIYNGIIAVSYTHLDVYKRQEYRPPCAW